MKFMNKIALVCALLLAPLSAVWAVNVEVFFLPHPPAVKVVENVEQIAAQFNNVTLTRHSFDDAASQPLVQKYGITGHLPVAIFIDGKDQYMLAGRRVTFRNFPKSDSFVPTFAGEWDYPDLKLVLSGLAR